MTQSFAHDLSQFPLDLRGCVESGQVFRWQKAEDEIWRGVDGAYLYKVAESNGRLNVETNACLADFEKLFRFDEGFEVSDKLLRLGPELAPYLKAAPGFRLMRPSDTVETIFSFMCTPNNHVGRITKMVRGLASYGEPLGEFTRFPSLERIARIPEQELRLKGFGYRGATIPRLAQTMVKIGGDSYLADLGAATYEDLHKELLSLHGIGPKLADCIALFAFHRTEAVPIDTHIWRAMTRHYFPQWKGVALTGLKYREAGDFMRDRFGSLAGWAQQFLFFGSLKRIQL